jgi:hypothetical protein
VKSADVKPTGIILVLPTTLHTFTPLRSVSALINLSHRYSRAARKALAIAFEQAVCQERSVRITTAHILLGLLREGDGAAAAILKDLGLDIDRLRREIESRQSPEE